MPKLTRLWLAPAALSIVAVVLPGRGLARRAFERRVSVLFGIDSRLARELLAAARTRRRERYVVRSMAFLLATTRVSPRVLPLALRSKAIQSFVGWLFAWHPEDFRFALAYAGHPRSLSSPSCPGLIPP